MLISWCFTSRVARPVAGRIVVPAGPGRNEVWMSVHDRHPGMAPDGVVGQFQLVSLADQHPQRALAVARCCRRVGEAAAKEFERRLELLVRALTSDRGGDMRLVDSELREPAPDPLRAPAVETPAVVGEAVGEALVVEVALLA